VDRIDELRKEQEEMLTERKIWEDLLAFPGWSKFYHILTDQMRFTRKAFFDEELNTFDSAFRVSGQKGQVTGLQIAMATPTAAIESLDIDLEMIRAEITELQDE